MFYKIDCMRKSISISKFIFLFLLAFNLSAFSENSTKVDSLKILLVKASNDTNKVNLLNSLAEELQSDDPDKAIKYSQEQVLLAEKLSFKKGQLKAYQTLSYAHTNKGEYDLAISFSLKAIKLSELLKNKKEMSASYTLLGVTYYYMGNYTKALEYWEQSLKIDEEIGDEDGMSKLLNNIGNVYEQLGKYDEALENFKLAYTFNKKNGSKNDMASNLNNIGNVYDDKKDFLKAIDFYQQSLSLKNELGDKKGATNTILNISHAYYELNDYAHGLEYVTKGYTLAKEIGNKSFIRQAYAQYADIYSLNKNFEKAYEYKQLESVLKDSLLNEEITLQTSEMDAKYQNEKKESQILLLNKENEKQTAVAVSERKRHQLILIFVTGFFILLAVFTFYILRGYRQKQKANKDLEDKNSLIEQKNKDITDSINYAKKIQEAILPAKALKRKLFDDAFVLLIPRDIVSGDFYWFTEKNGKRLIAAADCTGHGVPGAFMSMIGNAFLNEIVNEKGITTPSEILNQLRDKVILSLKQEDNEGHNTDGMDISLLCIDDKNNTVEFAGANNPFWYIHNGVLTEIKGDKQPIGTYYLELKSFTNHKVQVQKGDALYILSDGYADQFGGEKGKKFRYKQLQEVLVSMVGISMLEQEKMLVDKLNKWKGNLEQVDDVLVIGIKI